ncbi:unnamed protein product [Rhizoctonia solani]|uniref:Uncharacterized protein n=1 Tax=Rhizoctonia solani TaxID=456999 RepID=A0A8H3HPA4_9AGAM|nr:unnamed protein product [Rhizoctonia solani]CAE6534471.1 unnamed protein product [Rhizoctonia solani]
MSSQTLAQTPNAVNAERRVQAKGQESSPTQHGTLLVNNPNDGNNPGPQGQQGFIDPVPVHVPVSPLLRSLYGIILVGEH